VSIQCIGQNIYRAVHDVAVNLYSWNYILPKGSGR